MVCKKCSKCRPGFQVVRPCERRKDTVCQEKCRSPVEFGDCFSIRGKKEYINEDNQFLRTDRLIGFEYSFPVKALISFSQNACITTTDEIGSPDSAQVGHIL